MKLIKRLTFQYKLFVAYDNGRIRSAIKATLVVLGYNAYLHKEAGYIVRDGA